VSELLTVQEAAAQLRVSRRTLYRLIAERRIAVTKVRGSSFVTAVELERYVKAAGRGGRLS
jgi:excisionase family DNA binding protein